MLDQPRHDGEAVVPFIASFGDRLIAKGAKAEVLEVCHAPRPDFQQLLKDVRGVTLRRVVRYSTGLQLRVRGRMVYSDRLEYGLRECTSADKPQLEGRAPIVGSNAIPLS